MDGSLRVTDRWGAWSGRAPCPTDRADPAIHATLFDVTSPRSFPRAIVLVACGLLAVMAVGCGRAGGEAFQPTQNTNFPLAEGHTVGQTINPVGGVVAGVDLQVATYARPADPDGTLEVTVRDPGSREVLGTAEVSGDDIDDLAWLKVSFDPAVAVDGPVLVETSWDGANPLALLANAPNDDEPVGAVDVRSALPDLVNDPYPAGQAVVDGVPAAGDLAFRVRGPGGPGAALGQVVEVVASTANRLAEQPLFALVWLVALAGSGALIVRGFRRRTP